VSPDELVARAAAMRDTLRARQAECESLGRLPDATNDEYIQAGFFRVLQPRRFGGYELGLEAFLRIAIELSRGCPSSGWVYALTAGHAHTVTMWPEQGQVELFSDGDFRCPFSNLPAQAVAVDGGFRIDGWWDYGSGCDIATHFIGGVGVVDAPGGEIVDTRWAAFPRDAYRIVDNWDTLGMRGTGSRRVVVEDLLVPDHHTVPSPNPGRPVVDFPGRACTRTRSTAAAASSRCSCRSPPRSPSASPKARSTTTSRSCRPATSTGRRRRCAASCRRSSATSGGPRPSSTPPRPP
jgi:alkylation response protein AidB-like acyl-CoA dehydrogenase